MAAQTEIAIVDDDASVRRALALLLEACSYQVRTYESAHQFLDSNGVPRPACLIVDQQMEEMTGEQLLHHLAHTGIRIPTVMLTGHGEAETREHALQAGVVTFLVKPVTPDQLLRAIDGPEHNAPALRAHPRL
jgi:FixJ family two-component response regulator